ncbi:MAG: hypothetical protein RL264_1935 [Bacteroidota bacterium]|jgi:calcineurin-like phosphoesterase family protein
MTRHIIIGDIHGCIQELELLLDKLNLKKEDKLYFIGDLIDKGPNSPAVVRKVFELSLTFDLVLILGNHEEKFLRYLKNKTNNENALNDMSNIAEFQQLSVLTADELAFLKNAYLYFYIPNLEVTLVHGGFPENTVIKPQQSIRWSEIAKEDVKKNRLLTMTRMLNEKGNFLGLNENLPEMYFWAEKYNARYGKVVFGHQPFIGEKIKQFPNAFGIDTGCVFGGALSALIFTSSGEFTTESQKALKKYCL